MRKRAHIHLHCFSPLVMVTTFVIELAAALFVLFRYRTEKTAKLIISILVCLAFFQLAEYMICESAFIFSSFDWARLGYGAITLLPPMGIHLGTAIAQRKSGILLKIAYTSAAAFLTYFAVMGNGIQGERCLGNYVMFSLLPHASLLFGFYYYGWLVTGVHLAWRAKQKIKDIKRKQALNWLVIGYLSFMVPTTIVNLLDPKTTAAIPSIMCGFAVLFAFCLLFKISPLILNRTDSEELAEEPSS